MPRGLAPRPRTGSYVHPISIAVVVALAWCAAADWPDVPHHAGDVGLVDVDGDGHLDAVFTYSDAGIAARRCLGNGAASFACDDVAGATAACGVAAGPLRR